VFFKEGFSQEGFAPRKAWRASYVASRNPAANDRSSRPSLEHKHTAALDHQENSAPQQLHESRFENGSLSDVSCDEQKLTKHFGTHAEPMPDDGSIIGVTDAQWIELHCRPFHHVLLNVIRARSSEPRRIAFLERSLFRMMH
jgi:hypothetical protein